MTYSNLAAFEHCNLKKCGYFPRGNVKLFSAYKDKQQLSWPCSGALSHIFTYHTQGKQ